MTQQKLPPPQIDLFGVKIDLWLEINGKAAPFSTFAGNAVDYIESVNIEIGLMENIRTEIKLCPPIDVGIKLLKSGVCGMGFSVQKTDSTKTTKSVGSDVGTQSTQVSMNKMMVRISYGGLVSPWFKTFLMMPELSLGEEGLDITLHGFGMLFEQTKRTSNFSTQMSAYDAVNLILNGKNLQPVFEPHAASVLKGANVSQISKKNQKEQLDEILRANNCKYVYVGSGGNTPTGRQQIRILHTEETRSKNNVVATFVAFKDINPNKRIYPILNMSAPMTNVAIGSALAKVTHNKFDRSTGKMVSDDVDYSKDVTPNIVSPDGSTGNNQDDTPSNQKGETASPDSGDALYGSIIGTIERGGSDMAAKVKGLVYDWMEKAFEFNCTSVCIPNILPAHMVNINVADIPALKNSFDLYKVRHNISAGGAETTFELKAMAGIASAAGQSLNKVAGVVIEKAQTLTGQQSTKTPTTGKVIQ